MSAFISEVFVFRDRPAAIPIDVKSFDDTSNFDEFPDVDLQWRKFLNFSLSFYFVCAQICVMNNYI